MVRLPKVITRDWLVEKNACWKQVNKFVRLYPNGFRVTRAGLLRAVRQGFSVPWLWHRVLSSGYRQSRAADRIWGAVNRYEDRLVGRRVARRKRAALVIARAGRAFANHIADGLR